ncbi:Hpt domain-containing protein [Pseudarthrobacter sp. NPDC080039]|uniref:Hpt domain-containing protein n=1 Tax=unclassified Pseudarthrobacter TaxID=2647000 RepID=UPI00344D909A
MLLRRSVEKLSSRLPATGTSKCRHLPNHPLQRTGRVRNDHPQAMTAPVWSGTGAENKDHNLPLLDPSVLERLRDELDGDEGIWMIFIRNFIAQLPGRAERVRHTLTTGDAKGAMDAVLSLRTSSQMVGAERLANLALQVEQALRSRPPDAAPAAVLPGIAVAYQADIRRCAEQTIDILEGHLG